MADMEPHAQTLTEPQIRDNISATKRCCGGAVISAKPTLLALGALFIAFVATNMYMSALGYTRSIVDRDVHDLNPNLEETDSIVKESAHFYAQSKLNPFDRLVSSNLQSTSVWKNQIMQLNRDVHVTNRLLDSAQTIFGDKRRWDRFLAKLLSGRCVTIGMIGGSQTYSEKTDRYYHRIIEWLNDRYPCGNQKHTWADVSIVKGQSITNVAQIAPLILKKTQNQSADLVILESAVNDIATPASSETRERTPANIEFHLDQFLVAFLRCVQGSPLLIALEIGFRGNVPGCEVSPAMEARSAFMVHHHVLVYHNVPTVDWVSALYRDMEVWYKDSNIRRKYTQDRGKFIEDGLGDWHINLRSQHLMAAIMFIHRIEQEIKYFRDRHEFYGVDGGHNETKWRGKMEFLTSSVELDSEIRREVLQSRFMEKKQEESFLKELCDTTLASRIQSFEFTHEESAKLALQKLAIPSSSSWSFVTETKDRSGLMSFSSGSHVSMKLSTRPVAYIGISFLQSYEGFGDAWCWIDSVADSSPMIPACQRPLVPNTSFVKEYNTTGTLTLLSGRHTRHTSEMQSEKIVVPSTATPSTKLNSEQYLHLCNSENQKFKLLMFVVSYVV